jgi:hypothetical protein
MAQPAKSTNLVTVEEWDRALSGAVPTRSDDTVVIAGGRRATLEELEAHIAADLAARAAEADG